MTPPISGAPIRSRRAPSEGRPSPLDAIIGFGTVEAQNRIPETRGPSPKSEAPKPEALRPEA
jgi:hypothetical protein